MWTKLLTALLFFVGVAHGQQADSQKVDALAHAIARQEGFYIKRSIPNRLCNPGDLKSFRGWRYPGQIGIGKGGHVRFRNAEAGWAALRHQIEKIIDGTSGHYSVNMTLRDMGKRYAGASRVWSKNVSRFLSVKLDTRLWEILDVPPILSLTPVKGYGTFLS